MTPKENYKKALQAYKRAEKSLKRAKEKFHKCIEELDDARKLLLITCKCGFERPISEIEVIKELRSSSFNYSSQEYDDFYEKYFICPKCLNCFNLNKTEELGNDPYKYVKVIHEWNRGTERLHGRVKEILDPYFEKIKKEEAEKKKKRDIENARKILKEAGEL